MTQSNKILDDFPQVTPKEAIDLIKSRLDEFTPRQRTIADFILQNPDKIAFLSITDIANHTGVSQATIVRFCHALGYDGFLQFSREIQQNIQAGLTSAGRFALARKNQEMQERVIPTVEHVFEQELQSVIGLSKNINKDDFYRCIDLMLAADRIMVIGCINSAPLAQHLGNMISKIVTHVITINDHSITTASALNRLSSKSMVISLAFPRYPRETVEITELASRKGAHIVAVTNSLLSPVIRHAELSFVVPVNILSYVDAYTAPMAFLTALAVELSERNTEQVNKALNLYDEYTDHSNLFMK